MPSPAIPAGNAQRVPYIIHTQEKSTYLTSALLLKCHVPNNIP